MRRRLLAPNLFLAPLLGQPAEFDAAVFKALPAQYRGHAMGSFPLTTLNESYVISGIQEMARLNYGGFFIEAAGRTPPMSAPAARPSSTAGEKQRAYMTLKQIVGNVARDRRLAFLQHL